MEIKFRRRALSSAVKTLLVLGLTAALVLPVYAALTGDIEGTVLDSSGAVVSDATVKVRNKNTGATRTLTTNSLGQFTAQQMELGNYEITVEKSGFRSTKMAAEVRSAEKTRLSIDLQVGSGGEVIEVEGGATPLLDVGTAQVSNSIDSKTYVALPSQNRDPVAFANLSPGVVPVTMDNPFLGSGSFNSNGSRGRGNNITVDNSTASDISTTGSSGTGTFSLDGVQEFKLITNNFDAEYGRNSGAQVQIITKQGGNAYHGTAYWFHQNGSVFNARDYFNPTCDPAAPEDGCSAATPLIRNLGGFTAGGPVIKNHTFVFGHWEMLRIRGAGSTSAATVLTPAQVAGITDPTSLALFNAVGAPTSASGTLNSSAPNLENQHSWSLRVDQILRGGKDTLTARYGENPVESINPGLTFIGTALPNYGASVTATDRTFTFGYTSTLTSSLVNQFRFTFGRSNPNFPPSTTLSAPFAPVIQVGPGVIDTMGVSNILPQGRTQNTYQYGDTVSWTQGRHSWKFGGDIFRYLAPSVFDANFRGTLLFGSIAAFQAGTPTQWTQRVGSSVRHNKSLDHFWFVQDDYRVTDTLTLNLGFRLESSGGVSEENGILSNLNRNSNTPLGGGGTGPLGSLDLGGQSFERTYNPAPRFGFAWNPNRGKFVVRGGYGIAYDFIFLNPITNLRFSAPFVPSITVTSFTGADTYANLVAGTSQAQSDAIAAIGTFLPTQTNFGTISPVDQQLKNPRNQQMNLGVEYSLARDFVLKGSYIHTKNDYLQASIPINLVNAAAIPAPATDLADEAARFAAFRASFLGQTGNATGTVVNNRLDHRFNTVTQVQSVASSNFNALQLQAVKRFGHGFSFDTSYTYGHSIDNASDVLNVLVNDTPGLNDPRDLRLNRSNSQFDIRHRWVMSYVYELPFARNMHGAMGKILDGWGFSGVVDVRTGFSATVLSGTRRGINDILLSGNSTVRANGDTTAFTPQILGSLAAANIPAPCDRGVFAPTPSNPTCANISNFPLTQPLLGNSGTSGRNTLQLDGFKNVDFALLKNTKITEGTALQFRWEVYNILNHPNFSQFNNTLSSANFGTYGGTASNMRQMQGSLKFVF